jgi:hypothetical protein
VQTFVHFVIGLLMLLGIAKLHLIVLHIIANVLVHIFQPLGMCLIEEM